MVAVVRERVAVVTARAVEGVPTVEAGKALVAVAKVVAALGIKVGRLAGFAEADRQVATEAASASQPVARAAEAAWVMVAVVTEAVGAAAARVAAVRVTEEEVKVTAEGEMDSVGVVTEVEERVVRTAAAAQATEAVKWAEEQRAAGRIRL